MARLDKTIQNYQEQLKVKGIKDIPEFVQSILNADITQGKYSRFLLNCYLNNKFREEDLEGGLESTVGHAVTLFHKHKSKLPEEQRSVYKYGSPGDLWNAVKQFDGELSGKEIKKKEQDKIYAETEFLYEDIETGFRLISPLTEDAAKWWGKGTRWCTSAENDNMFYRYVKDAPLLIFLMPDGEKLQLWKYENDIQFMDEADNKVPLEYIEKNWKVLYPICHWLKCLENIPEEYRSYDICLDAVKKDGKSLFFVPERHRDYDLCLEAVKQQGITLYNVPKELLDYNLCLEAVKQYGFALSSVPEEYKNYNLCLEAVKKDGKTLNHIKKELLDYNLCLEAVKQYGFALSSVPKRYRDYNLCLEAVKKDGKSLFFVPQEIIDYNMCLEAVKQDGDGIKYIPEEYRSYDLCLEVVKQNGESLEDIPEKFRDYNLCLEAVKQDGEALRNVPKEYRDYNLCLEAIKHNGYALRNVPKEHKDYNMCLEAVKRHGRALQYVPDKYKDKLQEKLQSYLDETKQIPEDIYQQVFSEIRSIFPEKELSLTM